ncbi:DNA polymerase III PolC [Streptococcus mitis 13/39]|uniref:DNA polymerase III PolC n=1 Tax=Streptococcus mitis 13/39 TaxID=1239793 RepID=R0M9H6_STRMT|nr:DNA polymerase III PolC [Streptococcus mitis 13/39]
MSNSFEILMNQLGISTEMRQAPALAQADIERVVVHKISKVWEFHFVFSNILPIEIFLELKKGLSEEFSKTGNKAVFEIKTLSQEFSNQLLQSYYREAFLRGHVLVKVLSPFIRICEFVRRAISYLLKDLSRLIKNTLRKIIFLI